MREETNAVVQSIVYISYIYWRYCWYIGLIEPQAKLVEWIITKLPNKMISNILKI